MAEHSAVNRRVVGSSPTRGAILNLVKATLKVAFYVNKYTCTTVEKIIKFDIV